MLTSFVNLMHSNSLFWCCALSGAGLFIIQFLLLGLGVGDDYDNGLDAGKIQWLSKQAVTSFLMMFGLSALTCRCQFGLSHTVSSVIGTGVGIIAIFVLGYVFKIAKKLHSAGIAFNIKDLVGKEAVVYQRIPRGGVGKITISCHNLTYEIDAVAEDSQEISSFISVQITQQKDNNTVVVIPKQSEELGICQGGAPVLIQAKPAQKQLNLKSLAMQAGSKTAGCPTPAETDSSGCFGIHP